MTQDIRNQQSSPQTSPPQALLGILLGTWVPRAVQTAAELGLADLLADGPRGVNELATATKTHAPSLYRLFRALASVDVFSEIEPRVFAQTDYSAYLVSSHPASLRDIARMSGAEWQWRTSAIFTHSIETGEPAFDHIYGVDLWRYFDEIDPAAGEVFDGAMTNLAVQSNELIAKVYDFSAFRTLVDVGSGRGSPLTTVLGAYPRLHGILFDRPSVVARAQDVLRAAGVANRCQVVPGDFLTDPVPAGADAYMLRDILHDWNDQDACAILRNCREAMSGQGRVLVIEQIVPPPPAKVPWPTAGLDLMIMKAFGGAQRTEQQFRELFEAAGFSLTRVLSTPSPFSVVEGVPC